MKATRKSVLALIGAMATMAAVAAPSVEITAVQQQYPWTNTVDITYVVQGVTNVEYFVRFTPTTSDDKEILDVNGEPSIQEALVSNGVFTAQWYPQTNLQYTACKMTPAIFRGGSGGGRDYLIIDLEDWTVTYEPMATQEASNQRYNTAEYKTKKMVFRKIPADTYTIGHDTWTRTDHGTGNTAHKVTFPADYYVSIYEVTGGQYQRILGNGTSDDMTPQRITWNDARGAALVAAKPNKGILYTLSNKTGLCVDLPTHAMFEAAMRGGVTTRWLGGDDAESNKDYAPSATGGIYVGKTKPNAWGIYEAVPYWHTWTRDASPSTSLAAEEPALANNFTPISKGDLTYRIISDSYYGMAYDDYRMAMSSTWANAPSSSNYNDLRLAIYPQEYYPNGGTKK